MVEFFTKFFNFFDENFPKKNIHKLPEFYSKLGLKCLLPFSRGNKTRIVEKEFRKFVLGGDWKETKILFLMKRLLHFQEIWLMGKIGLWCSLIHHSIKNSKNIY